MFTGKILQYIYIYMLPPPQKSTLLSHKSIYIIYIYIYICLNILISHTYTYIYIYTCSPQQKICFDIAERETRQTQPKHVRAILSVEKKSSDGLWSIYWHGQELYLSRDG